MFAPFCRTCLGRVLLGTERIVRFAWNGADRVVVLRCVCGELVAWDQEPPAEIPERLRATA